MLPHDEDAATDALARLHAAGESHLGEGARLLGSFRAHGLLVPVWELDPGSTPPTSRTPVAALADRLADALAVDRAADAGGARARPGLLNRQVTLR